MGQPITITPPCAVKSPMRAAGRPPMRTVADPFAMRSGGPTHVAISVTRAAGCPPIKTVRQPGGRIGPPTCGTGPVERGQVCISPTLAAGGIEWPPLDEYSTFRDGYAQRPQGRPLRAEGYRPGPHRPPGTIPRCRSTAYRGRCCSVQLAQYVLCYWGQRGTGGALRGGHGETTTTVWLGEICAPTGWLALATPLWPIPLPR
jgi:hypothetical protein